VIVSADTPARPLQDVAARQRALRPAGGWIFTVEQLVEAGGIWPRPSHHGRYSHAREHCRTRARGCDLRRDRAGRLRLEAGDPVAGLVVRATKPADAGLNHAYNHV
jgi:predicted TPR repeat methyltransferase